MRIAYADPPYPGQSHLYRDHADYAGEVDHGALLVHLDDYDGWILHTSATALSRVLAVVGERPVRVCAWVKPFAAFKSNVSPAYAWEPVIVSPARRASWGRVGGEVMRDWLAEPMTLRRGLTGAKPARVCRWLFGVVGAEPSDDLVDLFPGTGAVSAAWDDWRGRWSAGSADAPTLFA